MDDEGIWPPVPKNQPAISEPAPRQYLFVKVPLLALGFGFVLGGWDITRKDDWADWATFGAVALLGFLHPKTFLLSAFLLSLCLYLVHIAAVMHGLKSPYVEPNTDQALNCWQSVFPKALGTAIGALLKVYAQYEPMGPQKQ